MATEAITVRVPDIGDFRDVEVIEVLVVPGQQVEKETSLITLESDKATLDIPSPAAGAVQELLVAAGDRVSEGTPILKLAATADKTADATAATADAKQEQEQKQGAAAQGGAASAGEGPAPAAPPGKEAPAEKRPQQGRQQGAPPSAAGRDGAELHAEVLVLGAGPGGYTAAFRAADLGKKTLLVERYPALGGVCLNVGCIPSKALLHAARVLAEVEEMAGAGIHFREREIRPGELRAWTETVVAKLTGGLKQLARQRRVEVWQGEGRFLGPHTLAVRAPDGKERLASFDHAIVAAGSRPARLPGQPADPRILDSTSALALQEVPATLLVAGGGIIGLEMATVYQALGSRVTVVEMADRLLGGCDPDIVAPLQKRIEPRYEAILLNSRIESIEAPERGPLQVRLSGARAGSETFDAVLVAAGRRPNGGQLDLERAGVRVTKDGFVPVDQQQRTNVSHIYAVGDIASQPMLAHKASHEGKVAAEVAAGLKSGFEGRVIPSIAYTDPEVAWVGLTETEARARGIEYGKGLFPWAANGRSLTLGRDEGLTKLLFERGGGGADGDSEGGDGAHGGRLLGMAAVGPAAGDLIAEGALAIEMGCDARDLSLTVHPHPTLSETVAMAAEAFEGTLTDLYLPRRR